MEFYCDQFYRIKHSRNDSKYWICQHTMVILDVDSCVVCCYNHKACPRRCVVCGTCGVIDYLGLRGIRGVANINHVGETLSRSNPKLGLVPQGVSQETTTVKGMKYVC